MVAYLNQKRTSYFLLMIQYLIGALAIVYYPSLVFDIFCLYFISSSILSLLSLSSGDRSSENDPSSNLARYFASRSALLMLLLWSISGPDSAIPKSISAVKVIFRSEITVSVIFVFLLLLYWQVVSKGLARYGEIIARFFLDALPGQQMGIESRRRDGLLSARAANSEREDLLRHSLQLGTLDAVLRLSIGNVVIIVAGVVLFGVARLYFSWSEGEISTVIRIGEMGSLGFWLVLDAILFFAPYTLIMSRTTTSDYSSDPRGMLSQNIVVGSVLLLLGLFSLFQVVQLPYEALLILASFFAYRYFRERSASDSSKSVSNSGYLVIDTYSGRILNNQSFKGEYSRINPKVISISVSGDLLIKYYGLLSVYPMLEDLRELSNQLQNYLGPVVIKLGVLADRESTVEFLYPDSNKTQVLIPCDRTPLDMHIYCAKSIFSNVNTACEKFFPQHSWIMHEEYDEYSAKGFPFENWPRCTLSQLCLDILKRDFATNILKEVTLSELIEESHELSLGSSSGISTEKLVIELGPSRILAVSRSIMINNHRRVNINRLIDSCFLAGDDDDLIISEYLRSDIVNNMDEYTGRDGLIRLVLLSDKTCTALIEEYLDDDGRLGLEGGDVVNELKVFLAKTNRICSDRGVGPVIVAVPGADKAGFELVSKKLGRQFPSCIFVPQSVMPEDRNFLPLFRK
ncbi:MAG TPA: FHIPEP family type III secretion protein [Oligoflexia bacterium]|nr:FHIPEP family type III secretion protein [Oligoflexia bacterium]HMP47087.1 FHIPEP family type III secretion protein [Oligoflexia bacterium]